MPAKIETYIGRKPAWHNMGVVTGKWFSAEEALSEGLDWEVELMDVFAKLPDGTMIPAEYNKATIRKTENAYEVLGIVSPKYGVVQNRQAFQFADEVVGNIGGAHYETALSLKGGRQVCMCIATEATDIILDPGGRGDKIKSYILLVNSHDGSLAFLVKITNVRVVCANTLAMALRENQSSHNGFSGQWSTRHTTDILKRTEMAKRTLGLYRNYNELWAAQAELMIETDLSDNTFQRLVEGLFEDVTTGSVVKEKDKAAIEQVRVLYELSPTNVNVFGTVWGGLQAVTEYADWYVPVRGSGKTTVQESRFMKQTGIEGGSTLKQRAWDIFFNEVEDKKKLVSV